MTYAPFDKIQFGDGLTVTDEGGGIIRVDAGGGGGGGGGGGIQFDTYPQSGGWLYVETTDSTTAPNGWAIELHDTSGDDQNPGILIQTDDGNVLIVGDGVGIGLNTGGYSIDMDLFSGMVVTAPVFQIVNNANTQYDSGLGIGTPGGHRFKIAQTGGFFEVKNTAADVLFHIDGNGDLTARAALGMSLTAGDTSMYFTAPDFYFDGVAGPSNPAATNVDFVVNIGGIISLNAGALEQITMHYTAGIQIYSYANGIALMPGSGVLTFGNLPTSNPGGTGHVWNDSGTLKIT